MWVKISHWKGIIIGIICIAIYFAVCPLYIKWVFGNYTRQFADVLNSHDMVRYDDFFAEDTVFELDGRQIKYADAKENMENMQTFTSVGSYGFLDEWFAFKEYIMEAVRKEHRGCLMLPLSDSQNGKLFIEGEIILERKWLFFFDIEKVTFYEGDDEDRFLKDFLGI